MLWSGWPDSNRRPPRPKRGALAKLRYSPYTTSLAATPPYPAQARMKDLRRFVAQMHADYVLEWENATLERFLASGYE
jgi:hypothetical protein